MLGSRARRGLALPACRKLRYRLRLQRIKRYLGLAAGPVLLTAASAEPREAPFGRPEPIACDSDLATDGLGMLDDCSVPLLERTGATARALGRA